MACLLGSELIPDDLLAPQHVVELELDDVPSLEGGRDVPDDQIAGAKQTPVLEIDLFVAKRPAGQTVERDRLEQAGTGEVVGNDVRNGGRWGLAAVLPSERDDRDELLRLGALGDRELDDRAGGVGEAGRERGMR